MGSGCTWGAWSCREGANRLVRVTRAGGISWAARLSPVPEPSALPRAWGAWLELQGGFRQGAGCHGWSSSCLAGHGIAVGLPWGERLCFAPSSWSC